MNTITINFNGQEHIFTVDVGSLKNEIKNVSKQIVEIKTVLREPHNARSAPLQSELHGGLKPKATFLCVLRTALRGRFHNSCLNATKPGDARSASERQNDLLARYLIGHKPYCSQFIIN